MSIYDWTLGEVARARICKQVYAIVKVIKDEDGIFFDDKVLAINANEDGTLEVTEELCYYVEILRSNQQLWLPYTSLHLAERSRPFYGKDKIVTPKPVPAMVPKKRKLKEDHILPLSVKISKHKEPDLNTTYDMRHMPLKQGKYENAFKEFVRRGKEMLFDHYYFTLKLNSITNDDRLDYLENVNASTEDKFEMVIKAFVTEKEIENYLHQSWRFNFVHKQKSSESTNQLSDSTNKNSEPLKTAVTVHIPWCLVCGKGDRLQLCPNCPSSFHNICRREWLVKILHRKKAQTNTQKQVTLVEKILSSTRTKCRVLKDKENMELCPSCMWGPRVGYDDVVWHKLGSCPWWPARVLTPGSVPSCLLARSHSPHQWPLKYYGTLNYSWGDTVRMCLFLPSHVESIKDEEQREAAFDACDDYISVYLT